MRKLIVSLHSTANDIVTGPPSDETNFMVWAQAGIEDSLESFPKSLANVDTILLGRATYEDCLGSNKESNPCGRLSSAPWFPGMASCKRPARRPVAG
jgi:hypothetical protein